MNTLMSFSSSSVAEVVKAIAPNNEGGRVAFQCTFWPARYAVANYSKTLPCGREVKVVGRDGITLLVVPL